MNDRNRRRLRREAERRATLPPGAPPAATVRPRRRSGGRLVWRILLIGGVALLAGTLALGGLLYTYAGELPSLDHLSASALPQSTRIYARDGTTLLDERFYERRTVVPISAVAWDLRHATIAIEDRDFYNHGAINPLRTIAAAVYDVLHRRAAQGGSTITQQLVKNTLLQTSGVAPRSLDRKVKEFMLAIELERRYSKDQILELYLDTIFYGNGAYGIESAAQTYFGIPASRLDLAQASLLAGLPQAPSAFNPFLAQGFARARVRQSAVLSAMVRDRYVTAAQAARAFAQDLRPALAAAHQAIAGGRSLLAPHFVDYVWSQLEQQYDPGFLLRGGLRIITTLDAPTQALAQKAVRDGVARFSRGYRVNNGAMLVLNPHTGAILAMVGSADYFNQEIGGEVNYTLALRQPGSSFKPYTYVTALLNGWTPASPLQDANGLKAFPGYPVHDWDSRELGTITLRQSLQQSRNISSVHLFQDVGISKVFTVARQLGITSPLDPVLPATLGASPVSMIEHLAAYSAFANGGTRVRPFGIQEVLDSTSTVLERNDPKPDSGERVLPQSATYILTDILKGAVHPALPVPVAAKSGTTSDFKDAWYIGYSSDLAVAAWMGRTVMSPTPHNESMNQLWGETGPGAVWHAFMSAYYAAVHKPADWTRPQDVVREALCKATGQPADSSAAPDLTVMDLTVRAALPTTAAPCGEPSSAAAAVPAPSPTPAPDAGLPGVGISPAPIILPTDPSAVLSSPSPSVPPLP
ncbi:MAG TPA: transglycosylase domain-containing protein [Candidatus Limnocylindrales bacterium]|nr:transglycosylase domain-containing protein [Candidatus Limnocylindrales bacterium]